jgi:hypothetical protein
VIKISPIREAGKHPIVGLVMEKLQLCSLPDIDGAPREEKSPPGYSREPPSDDDDTPLAFGDDAVKTSLGYNTYGMTTALPHPIGRSY